MLRNKNLFPRPLHIVGASRDSPVPPIGGNPPHTRSLLLSAPSPTVIPAKAPLPQQRTESRGVAKPFVLREIEACPEALEGHERGRERAPVPSQPSFQRTQESTTLRSRAPYSIASISMCSVARPNDAVPKPSQKFQMTAMRSA